MCRQCAGVPLCQLEFVQVSESVCETMWSFQQYEELLPVELKLLASGDACSPKLFDREAPDCCDLFPEDVLWHFWLLHRLLSSRLSGKSLSRAHVQAASCLQTLSQCRAYVKSERGNLLALTNICSLQHRLPKPQIPSQSVFSARMHRLIPHKAWSLITERRENQNWLLIELPG